jgi:chromosome segregation ATPase
MSSDSVHSVDVLSQRVKQLELTSTRLATLRDRVANELASKKQEVHHLEAEIALLSKVVELFRMLMDQLVEKQVRSVEKIATEGLQTIFPDLNLSLESEVGPKHNKISVDFFIRRGAKTDPRSHRGRPLEAFGGGPSSVVSLILRVLAVKRMKQWPLLVLDESLGAVSDAYIEQTGQFLKGLAEKLHFDILLVTHKTAFLEHATVAYRCSELVEDDGVTTHLGLRRASS